MSRMRPFMSCLVYCSAYVAWDSIDSKDPCADCCRLYSQSLSPHNEVRCDIGEWAPRRNPTYASGRVYRVHRAEFSV